MKGSSLFSLFLLMVVIILTTAFYDKFNNIEEIFSILFWFFIIGLLGLSALMPIIDNSKGNDND